MGCKFSNKETTDEDNNEILNKITYKNESDTNYKEEPRNEADVQIKVSDLIGERKGNINDYYDFQKVLGEGAFGQVKQAKHKISGQTRAVKFIKKVSLSQSEEEELRNEIEILRKLDHPHIIKVFEYFVDKSYFYIVTEFCSGGELFERIVKAGTLSEKKAAKVMTQILLAINYCHKNKIVHRDLKPENILYENSDEDSSLKIIDFGTSTLLNAGKILKEHVGTSFYIAPEVLKGTYDMRCDLWSCGVILYILLAGYPPFRGDTDEEIYKAIQKGEYNLDEPELAAVSKDAKNLIKKLLEYNPSKRYFAESALQDPWIKNYAELPDKPLINKALVNMKSFRAERKIQLATWSFFTNFLSMNDEKEDLLKIFKALDANGDGKLTKQELIEGYKVNFGLEEAKIIVDDIMKNADIDGNGNIEYNEFLMLTMNREKMLSKEKLKEAFKLFDEDQNGYISINEFKNIFCHENKIPNTVWEEMISAIDLNKDGKVSCEEFITMMQKLVES